MIPVEVNSAPWHFTTWLDLFDHWQTGIAGFLAFVAGFGTVVATIIIARRQIAASNEDAKKVIAATLKQASATADQTAMAVRLNQMRAASEALAFRVMLEAAMVRVLAEAAWARETHPHLLTPQTAGASPEALDVRRCVTKGAFAELRAACVRQGGPLTGEFLDLEREIDNFALQWEDGQSTYGATIRMGKHAGLGEKLDVIERKATALRERAAERMSGEKIA
jgi:hypothetical protein